ncbi:Uncharacterized protein Fot_16663 [Forsythia ovata]|uniref:Uncharacterized protein n=1 Tax=Forsythia ovata TaxID=205694 RepID=A0ABD1VD44_9LAMI
MALIIRFAYLFYLLFLSLLAVVSASGYEYGYGYAQKPKLESPDPGNSFSLQVLASTELFTANRDLNSSHLMIMASSRSGSKSRRKAKMRRNQSGSKRNHGKNSSVNILVHEE